MVADPRIFGVPVAATELGLVPTDRLAQMVAAARTLSGVSAEEVERRTRGAIRAAELLRFEAGEDLFSEQEVRRLAEACGFPVQLIMAVRARLVVDLATKQLRVGDHRHKLKDAANYDRVLVDYLQALYEIREVNVGTPLALREEDLEELGRATGHTVDEVRTHLDELMTVGHRIREQRTAARRRIFWARLVYTGAAMVAGSGIGAAVTRFTWR